MKRIQLQCLFFIFCFFLLTGCSIVKTGKHQAKISYLNAERIKLAHFERDIDKVLTDLDSRTMFRIVSDDNIESDEIQIRTLAENLCEEYKTFVNTSGVNTFYENYNDVLEEEKCCDPNHDPCPRMCKCYLISAVLEHIVSNDELLDFTISDTLNQTVFARIEQPFKTKVLGTYTYKLNYITELEVNQRYLVTTRPIVDGVVTTYTSFVTTY